MFLIEKKCKPLLKYTDRHNGVIGTAFTAHAGNSDWPIFFFRKAVSAPL